MRFNYQARTKRGETQTGVVEAGSREAAVETLQRHDLLVVYLEELSQVPFYTRSLRIFQRIKAKEITIFYRQLAILFEASVSPLDSLRVLAEQTRNPLFRDIIFEIENDVKGGENLSDAMAKYPKVFSAFYVNVVKAGEATGKLHEVLRYLADHAENEYNLTFKVKGALTYPAVILSLFVIVAALMMIYVIPQLTSILQETGQKLPFTTMVLIKTSKFLQSWFWLIGLAAVGLVAGIIRFIRTEKGQMILDTVKLRIPILKSLFQKIYLTRLAENLKTLLVGGIPILKALDIASIVIGNKIFEKIINEARDQVKAGKTISSAFSNYPKQITPMFTQMIGVGEKTAELGIILEKIAYFYQQEVDRTVANLTQLIEPFMLLFLGAGVAFLVSSILMPIYNFASGM